LSQLFASLRLRLFLLVVLVCAPLAGVIVHSAWDGRRSLVADWARRSRQMMQLAAREEARLIGQAKQLLLALAESSQVRSGKQAECKKLLDEVIASYPRYANLEVVDINGEVLASALLPAEPSNPNDLQRGAERLIAKPAGPPATTVSQFDRRLFDRILQTQAFAMGDFAAALARNHRIIDFGCPVLDSSGQVRAVVFAALDLAWVNRFETDLQVQLPHGAAWAEINRNGTILARHPAPESWTGRLLPERSLVETVFTKREGVVESLDAQGVLNFYAFAARHSQLVADEVVAILGIPKQVLFADVNRKLVRSLVGLGAAASLALFLGWLGSNVLVLRRVKALVKSSARLAAGDLGARTGLSPGRDELGQLTRTFDQMAQVLERHETERERAKNRLQALSSRLVEAQESERRHIARELHDQVGQALTVAQMNLQAAVQSAHGHDQSSRLMECLDVIDNVLNLVHDLSLNLRPSMLDDLGLEPALRWFTERQASLADLRYEVRTGTLDKKLDPIIKTECFRVAQEALTNVVRHAKASVVKVELRNEDGLLHLRVRDDGVGFDVNSVRERAVRGASLGLLSMEERSALAGGGLEFKSAPEQGTEVHAWFPTRMPVPKPFMANGE